MADGSWSPSIEQSINLGYEDPGHNYNFDQSIRLNDQIYANEHGLPTSAANEYVEITTGDIEVVKEAGGQGGLTNDEFLAQFAGDVSLLEQYLDELETSDWLGVDGAAESGTQLNPLKTKLESSRIYGTDIIIVDDNNPNYDANSSYAMSNADFNRIGTDPSLAAAVGEGKDSGMWNILPNYYQDRNQAAQRATAMGLWGNEALGYPTYSEYLNKDSDWWDKKENEKMASLLSSGISYEIGNNWTQFLGQDANRASKGWDSDSSMAKYDSKDPGISSSITTSGKQYDGKPQQVVINGKVTTIPGYRGGEPSTEKNPMVDAYNRFEKSLPNTSSPEGVGPSKFSQNFGDGASKVGGIIGDVPRYAGKGINFLSKGAGKLFGLIPGQMGDRLESGFNQFGEGVERFGTGVDDWMGSAPGDFIEGTSAFGQGLGGYLSGDMRRGNASMGQAGRRFFEGGRDLIEVPARGISDALGAFSTATNANFQIGGTGVLGRGSGGGASRNPNATKRTTTPSQRSGSLINRSSPGARAPGSGGQGSTGGTAASMGSTPSRQSKFMRTTPDGTRTVDLRKKVGQQGYLAGGGSPKDLNALLASLGQPNFMEGMQLKDNDDSFDLSKQYRNVDYTPQSRPQEDHGIEELADGISEQLEEPDVAAAFQV